jgi:Domain of unknown function (DUF4349)
MRLREREELTPAMRRELAALEAELAVALRDDRPTPTSGFAERLDREVERGFRADQPRRRSRIRVTPLAIGSVASVFIVVVAVLSSGLLSGGGNESRTPHPSAPERLVQKSSGSSTSARSPGVVVGTPLSKGPESRKVERSASLALATAPSNVEDVADDVIGVADRYGGYVMRSSVSSGDSENAGATLDLRIPASRLQPALADLSKLAHVRSRTQSSTDITAQFGGPRRRLANALAERRALLRELAKATTPNETASIRARLRLADRRIFRARTALRRLDARVGLSAVAVTVEASSAEADMGGWTPGDAAKDALSVLGAVLGALIVALAVAVPLAIVGLAVLLTRRAFLRHARERALDA